MQGKNALERKYFSVSLTVLSYYANPRCSNAALSLPDSRLALPIGAPVLHFAVCFFALITVQGVIANEALFSFALSAVLVLAPLALAQQPAPRAITIDDYFQIREVRDPQLSPDAKWFTYTVKTALLKEDKSEERI
jgi:hypothetical protein